MNHSGAPGIRAIDVWDVLVAQILQAGSIGELLDDAIWSRQFTPYSYSAALADSTAYTPPAKTIVFHAHLDVSITANNKFYFASSTKVLLDAFLQDIEASKRAMSGVMYCDGTTAFTNLTGGSATLTLVGVSMA